MSEFSDRPLIADSLHGVRSFGVDTLGRLRGVTYPEVWRPGVNDAACLSQTDSDLRFVAMGRTSVTFGGTVSVDPTPPKRPTTKPTHDVATMKCGCGYYAYHDNGSNPHHRSATNVLGIVRGEGVATVGTRGFRCQRAEVVALVDPFGAPKVRSAWDRWSAFWDRGDGLAIPVGVLSSMALVFSIAASIIVSPWFAPTAFLALAGVSTIPATFHGIDLRYPDLNGQPPEGLRDRFALVRRNYPDVPVYASLDAAMRDFPLSTQPEPTPETADDFWTQSAS